MGISRSQFIEKVKRRLGHPLVKVELCDEQIVDHIDYARQKYIKWAVGNATQEVYFTLLLQAGKSFYNLPAGVTEVVGYDDTAMKSGGINTLFTIDNYMFMNGYYGNVFWGGYDMVSYHLVLDFLTTLGKYRTTPYTFRYHKSTNQLEVNPIPQYENNQKPIVLNSPQTGEPTTYYVDSPGFVLIRAYMVSGSTLPNYKPDWEDILKEIKYVVETKTLTSDDVDRKYILLKNVPYQNTDNDYNITYDIKITADGVIQTQGTDWYQSIYNQKLLAWDDYGLDGELAAGDVLEISYPVVYESSYYPDDWTDVTATSTEVEQFTLGDANVDNGFIKLQYPVWSNNVKVSVNGANHYLGTDYEVDSEDPRIIKWIGLGFESSLAEDDNLLVTYVTVRSKRPSYEIRSNSIMKQYTTRIENRKVTSAEIAAKAMTLEESVSVDAGVKMSVSGNDKVYAVDFTVSGTTLTWSGLGLDGIIAENDEVIVTYTSATAYESEMEEPFYDNDWMLDYVTAMSKITLGNIRRKFANFSSMGNQGISLDGDSLISDGQQEKERLEETLRDEEAYEGYGIEIGLM